MESRLKELLGDGQALQAKKTTFLEALKDKKAEKNRLKAYYELMLLAQSCLETAAGIDFTDFLEEVKTEIETVNTQATNMLVENQEHYRWSEQVRKNVFEESAEREAVFALGEEIRAKLDEMDRKLARQVENTKSQTFSNVSAKVNGQA